MKVSSFDRLMLHNTAKPLATTVALATAGSKMLTSPMTSPALRLEQEDMAATGFRLHVDRARDHHREGVLGHAFNNDRLAGFGGGEIAIGTQLPTLVVVQFPGAPEGGRSGVSLSLMPLLSDFFSQEARSGR